MKQDRLLGSILLAFCAFYGYLTMHLQRTTVQGTPDQAFLPTILVLGLAALSVILLLRKPKAQSTEGKEDDPENQPPQESVGAAFKIFLLIAFYYALIPLIGFLAGTIIGVFVFIKQTIKSNKVCAITAISTAVVLYVIFKVILHIQLPAGIIFG